MQLSSIKTVISCAIILYFILIQFHTEIFAASQSDFQNLPTLSNSLTDCSDTSQCDNVGSVCFNGPNNTNSGGCGTACGKENAWSKYEIKCKNLETDPNKIERCTAGLVYLEAVCATGDKCFAGETGLRAGSCTCGNYSVATTKYCCSASGQAEACVLAGIQDGQAPNEGQCPGGYIVDGSRVRGSSCTPIIVPPPVTSPPPAGSTCGATCIYSDPNTGACHSGNCLNGSSSCGFNVNCGFVSGCSTGSTLACPGGTPPPVHVPQGSCSVQQSCTGAHCTFNIDYSVDNNLQNNYLTTLRPNVNASVTSDFASGQPAQWDYQSGTYTASVRVRKTDGSAETNCQTQPFTIDITAPTCNSLTLGSSSVQQGTPVRVDISMTDNVEVASIELFRGATKIETFYNSARTQPTYQVVNYSYDTSNLSPGTYTITANAIDTADPGNPTTSSVACTKQLTITQSVWTPPSCNNGVFSGCKLQGSAVDCNDAGPGDPQYSNWTPELGDICQRACAAPNNTISRNQFCGIDSLTVSPKTISKTNNLWQQMTIRPIMGTISSGNIKYKFGTHSTKGTCSGTLCQGWSVVKDAVSNSSASFNWLPPQTTTPGTYTFAIFTSNNSAILATDTANFAQVCNPGDQRTACTTNACTLP